MHFAQLTLSSKCRRYDRTEEEWILYLPHVTCLWRNPPHEIPLCPANPGDRRCFRARVGFGRQRLPPSFALLRSGLLRADLLRANLLRSGLRTDLLCSSDLLRADLLWSLLHPVLQASLRFLRSPEGLLPPLLCSEVLCAGLLCASLRAQLLRRTFVLQLVSPPFKGVWAFPGDGYQYLPGGRLLFVAPLGFLTPKATIRAWFSRQDQTLRYRNVSLFSWRQTSGGRTC
jgi:hypothetical protein